MKKVFLLVTAALLTLNFAACSGKTKSSSGESNKPVKVTILSTSGANDSNTEFIKYEVEQFNKKFAGKYEVAVEWVPGAAEDIRTKLKMLNSSNSLPTIVTQLGAEPAFAQLLMKNNRLIDLKSAFDQDDAWKKVAIPESVKYNTNADGKMYTAPTVATSYVGMYYNKEYLKQVGYDSFPKTWDEFWDLCDKLKAKGIAPIALHTTETAWCPMLVAQAYIANDTDGRAFYMNQQFPTNYNVPTMEKQMQLIKRIFTYSTPDAVGGKYAMAANNFCSGKTAMIPNGPWMINSLYDTQFAPEGFAKKVGYAPYPGNVMLSDLGMSYGEGISTDASKESQQGGIEWIKFLASPEIVRYAGVKMGNFSPAVPLTDSDKTQLNDVMKEYANDVANVKTTLVNYQGRLDPTTQNNVFTNDLPAFITGKMTLNQLLDKMTAAGQQYAKDNSK